MLFVVLFSITATGSTQEVPMLDRNRFETIVQFVLDNGWNAFISEDGRLTPNIRYKGVLVYIVPNFYTRQRETIHDYNRIIVFGEGAVPIRNEGPRFDIHKEGDHIRIEDKSIFDERIMNVYIALLHEMTDTNRIVENMNGIIDKAKFENIIQFVLDNGRERPFSSLWGMSPSITYEDITIFLRPNPPFFDVEYQAKMRNEVSHYNQMTVFFDAEGGSIFSISMGIMGNSEVYINAVRFSNRVLYENAIVNVAIPLLMEMINQ